MNITDTNLPSRCRSTVCSLSLSPSAGTCQGVSPLGWLFQAHPIWLLAGPQPRPSRLLSPGQPPVTISLLSNYLFQNGFFAHTELALGGCSIPLHGLRWPHLHEVKATNLKHTKQVPQKAIIRKKATERQRKVFCLIFPTNQKIPAVGSLSTPQSTS